MDIDTQMVIISNPDLEVELDQYADRNGRDPLKALKRRLDKHEFRYLTNLSLETELIRRELTNETEVWDATDYEQLEAHISEPVGVNVRDERETVRARELAPHAVEAAAMYSVVTRLDADDLPPELDLIDKAVLFDRGYLQEGDERYDIDEFDFDDGAGDGTHGIPVTYTRDVVADLLHGESDRRHPDLSVQEVIMPTDVMDAMADGLDDAPVFSRAERAEYENRLAVVKEYVFDQQESDVLAALLAEKSVEAETVEQYVEHVYAWATDGQVDTDRGPVDPDPLLMKLFETEHLGRFSKEQYHGNDPADEVEQFRRERIITALNRYAWENRDDGFTVSAVDFSEIPVIRTVLDTHSWDDVQRLFPDFDPDQWEDPPTNTETERVKERTLAEMERNGYSAASAELTSRAVMREVSYRWD